MYDSLVPITLYCTSVHQKGACAISVLALTGLMHQLSCTRRPRKCCCPTEANNNTQSCTRRPLPQLLFRSRSDDTMTLFVKSAQIYPW